MWRRLHYANLLNKLSILLTDLCEKLAHLNSHFLDYSQFILQFDVMFPTAAPAVTAEQSYFVICVMACILQEC